MRGLTQESGISGLGRFNAIILDFWYQQQEHRRRGAWSHSEAYRTCESPQMAMQQANETCAPEKPNHASMPLGETTHRLKSASSSTLESLAFAHKCPSEFVVMVARVHVLGQEPSEYKSDWQKIVCVIAV